MTAVDVIACIAAVVCMIAALALLRLRVYRHRIERLETCRNVLTSTNARLRQDLATATHERDTAVRRLADAETATDKLRDQLDRSLRWRRELRQAAAEETLLMQPPRRPAPNERDRPSPRRDPWATQMQARFQAPAVIPPHEQPDGGTK